MKNLDLQKEHLTRAEMRVISGGKQDDPQGCLSAPTCVFQSDCPNIFCNRCLSVGGGPKYCYT